ncbi:MAG: Sir2 family NAD-dependent protein deacetylase, partial [Verrucomicrobiota bacterium]
MPERPSRIFVLTGAGISAESGVPTFRDADGLWEGHRFEDVATPEAWASQPDLVWRFYTLRRQALKSVAPNPAHEACARLQSADAEVLLVTQNVDDLHERGGARDVVHMHGELTKLRCLRLGTSEHLMGDAYL